MSPTPATFDLPTMPSGYAWEATDEGVAARYGIPIEQVVRFDVNTSPSPPALAERLLAAGRFETTLSEYPPSDYRRLVAAAAERYGVDPDEVLVGAGADEILDLIAKAFLPVGSAAIVPSPTYSMYRIDTEQRPAVVIDVPRLGADRGHALDVGAIRTAAREERVAVVWLCNPNNPTALAEPDGAVETLLSGLADDAARAHRDPPLVVIDEAYAEFAGRSLLALRAGYPRLVIIRTASKAYALAGLRVGFALARPEIIQRMNPYRPPGSVSTVSVTVVTEALSDPTVLDANLERVRRERDRLSSALTRIGWDVGPSVTNFLLVRFGSRERAADVAEGLLRCGLVPRTFGAAHPLADHLRLTVRDPDENDRLISAVEAFEAAAPLDRDRDQESDA
ncbi:MAG: histidinol-phosphate aminotransferase family protein [Chloroflexota bacterium]|jgi:histidinol-phosphate aminotransferase|nr:histidinol-phosphate aminotransferase family protein [Chloroflexota bacterium]MDH5244381.1 histidinol-phosphate aminotransferase family protein [Chloroflexota bacterium]